MDHRKPIMEVKNLKKYFRIDSKRTLKAVDDVSFTIYEGETLGIVGESGCGKTTCGRTCIGVYDATEGEVLYKGKDVHKMSSAEKKEFTKKVQMIFQDPYSSLDPRLKVHDIIAEGMQIHGLVSSKQEEIEVVQDLLKQVGLNPEHASRYVHEFSGGQRQRIGIARALAVNPEFLMCDEPISALDVSVQAQVVNLLIKLAGSEELYEEPFHPYTKALLSAIPIPDPKVEKQRNQIRLEGEVPSPMNPPAGCHFCNRCAYATEKCSQITPVMREVKEGHFVACHLYDKE